MFGVTQNIGFMAGNHGDPYWGDVVLLMRLDTDAADQKGHTTTDSGMSFVSGRAAFDGVNYVDVGPSSDFLTDTSEDFTFEFFIEFSDTNNRYPIGIVAYSAYFSCGAGSLGYTQATSHNLAGAGVLTTGVRYHAAITRSGGVFRSFIGGTKTAEETHPNVFGSDSVALRIGRLGTFNGLNGYMDNVRLTRGVARYTADFTPPATPFPNY